MLVTALTWMNKTGMEWIKRGGWIRVREKDDTERGKKRGRGNEILYIILNGSFVLKNQPNLLTYEV